MRVEQGRVVKTGEQQIPSGDVPGPALVILLEGRRNKGAHGPAGQGGCIGASGRVPADMPLRGPELPAQQAQQRGFAGAVGAQHGAVVAARYLPVNAVQHCFLTRIAGQKKTDALHGDQRRG